MADLTGPLRGAVSLLAGRPGIVAVYEGIKVVKGQPTGERCVCVGVIKKLAPEDIPAGELIPGAIGTAKTDVVEVGEIKALALTERRRPCPGGYSVGHPDITAGTLGAWVRRKGDDRWFILSNNHVLANESRAKLGDPALQPGRYDGGRNPEDRIATLTAVAPFNEPVLVDGALAVVDNPADVDPTITGLAPVRGWRELDLKDFVFKTGRTTGTTAGTVVGINATVDVQFDTGTKRCEQQTLIGPGGFSAGGDSGSLIVTKEYKAGGLLFAGSPYVTIANRIANVMAALDLVFPEDPEPPPPPPPPLPGKRKTPLCRWWAAFRIANRRLQRRG